MPRMRILKPDFWSDKNMVKLSPFARLLYMGMWNFALCDHGHLPDDIEELQLKILPRDNVDPAELLGELTKADRVRRMRTSDGETFLWIPRLTNHQKVDPRWKSRCPYCSDPNPTRVRHTETPVSSPEFAGVQASEAETAPPAETLVTLQNSPESRCGSPELPGTHPVVELKGVELKGDEGISGRALVVTNGRAGVDLAEAPNTGIAGPAERIITTWIGKLPKPPQSSIVSDIGAIVARAIRDKVPEDDVAESLRLWQMQIASGQSIGPGVLKAIIHRISQQDTALDSAIPGTVVAMYGRPPSGHRRSFTDDNVTQILALAEEYERTAQ